MLGGEAAGLQRVLHPPSSCGCVAGVQRSCGSSDHWAGEISHGCGGKEKRKKKGIQGKTSARRSWCTVSNSFGVAGNNRRGLFLNNFVQLFSCISAKQIGVEQTKLEEVMGSCTLLAAVEVGSSRGKSLRTGELINHRGLVS